MNLRIDSLYKFCLPHPPVNTQIHSILKIRNMKLINFKISYNKSKFVYRKISRTSLFEIRIRSSSLSKQQLSIIQKLKLIDFRNSETNHNVYIATKYHNYVKLKIALYMVLYRYLLYHVTCASSNYILLGI